MKELGNLSTAELKTRVVELDDGYRYYLDPAAFNWAYQPSNEPAVVDLKLSKREANYDFARNEFDHLLICITNRCNIVCDYCFRGFNMRKTPELTYDNFTEVADHFYGKAIHKPTFQFTGGELFVRDDIEQMFEYIHERGFRIWMTTNGVSPKIRESESIRRIFENNPKVHVRVSCDGHTPELYERHRGKPGTFARVEQNLRYLVSIGVQTSIKTVVTEENFPYIEDILDWAYDLGLCGWNYNVIRYTGALASEPPPDATAKARGKIDYLGYYKLGCKLTDIIQRKPYLAPLLSISRYGKILDTLYGSQPHGVHMLYYVLNYDGEVYLNDNLYKPSYSRGNIIRDGISAFNGLIEHRRELDIDMPGCTVCPIHRFCFQKGDYGELFAISQDLTKEFPNCPDIREHFFNVLSLRHEGARLLALMNPPASVRPPPV